MDADRTTTDGGPGGGAGRQEADPEARKRRANAKRAATRHAWKMHIRDENFRKVMASARAGGLHPLTDVTRFLDRYPELWDRIDDASRHVRGAWVGAVTGGDNVRGLAVTREVDAFAAGLTRADDGPEERLVIGQAATLWLAERHAARANAEEADAPGVTTARWKRWEAYQRMLDRALRRLAAMRAARPEK